MKFYKRLSPISAISFDLDDTLYSNRAIMKNAEQQMLYYFAQHFPQTVINDKPANKQFWRQFRQQALQQQPELIHDVSALRLTSYQLAITSLGYNKTDSQNLAQAAFEHFLYHRSNFTIPVTSKTLLQTLAQHFPLVAITNGNVNFNKLGLDSLFNTIYFPGNGVKRKPDNTMFKQACNKLHIKPAQLLHVGDCGNADIYGALQAGCQAAWLNKYTVGKPITVLPHIELSSLDDLLTLI